MKFFFSCSNYRGLQCAEFEPNGVCALVGPNGSGKSTLLAAFEFTRNLYLRSTNSAISLDGGHWGLRNLNALSADPLALCVRLESDDWRLELNPGGSANELSLNERSGCGGVANLLEPSSDTHFRFRGAEIRRGEGSTLRLAYEVTGDPELERLVKFIRSLRTYRHYHLFQLRENGSRVDSDLYLMQQGDNLFATLRNWRDRRDYRVCYDFVVDGLRAAFPNFFEDLEFYGDAQTIRAKVYLRDLPEPMPLTFVPDGLLVAMLHLAAVAGSPGHSFIAIDDFENYLHPYAIRSLIENIRGWADRRDLSVLLATHSPVVLDEFRTDPSRVFVIDSESPSKPIALAHLRDPEWLAHFSLGDLYSQLEFGARMPLTPSESTAAPTKPV